MRPRPGGRDEDDEADDADDDVQALTSYLGEVIEDQDALDYALGLVKKCFPEGGMASDSAFSFRRSSHMTDTSTVRAVREIQAAEAAIKPYVMALDTSRAMSAGGVYLAALKALGHDVSGLDSRAAKAMFDVCKSQGQRRRPMAADSVAETETMRQRFPGAFALKRA